jgi:hypothetical protein
MQDWCRESDDVPTAADVLCGRTLTSQHPGNKIFRQLILAKVDDYSQSTTKTHKGLISEKVLNELDERGARFMKLDKKTNTWSAIPYAGAREKVSHAIRDQVRDRKRGRSTSSTLPRSLLSAPTINKTRHGRKRNARNARKPFIGLPKKCTVSKKKDSDEKHVATTRHVKVVQGLDHIVTLLATPQTRNRIASEKEDCLCSLEDKAKKWLLPFFKEEGEFPHGCYSNSNGSKITPDPILSCDMDRGDLEYHKILADGPAQELFSIVNEVDGADSDADSSAYLDEYNELTLDEISNHVPEEEASFIATKLEEVFSIILHDGR